MLLGEILIGRGLVTLGDIDEALHLQTAQGGRLGENLIALGRLTAKQLSMVIDDTPTSPSTVSETGIASRNLLNLLLKLMYVEALETVRELGQRMKLAPVSSKRCWKTRPNCGLSSRWVRFKVRVSSRYAMR